MANRLKMAMVQALVALFNSAGPLAAFLDTGRWRVAGA